MVSDWELGLFADYYTQQMRREAETDRMLKEIRKKTPGGVNYFRSLRAWLRKQLVGYQRKRQVGHREAANGEQSLISS
jgi:hypothetical protein